MLTLTLLVAANLDAAKAAYADVDYEKCRAEAQKALDEPGDKAGRVEANRLLGLCFAALGDTDAAREAFRRMIAIDKDARLPDGLSPRFTSAFREAKGSFTGAPLALVVDSETVEGGVRALRLKLTDELELVKNIAWRGVAGGASGGPVRAAALLEIEVPAESEVEVVGLDKAGGEVVTLAVNAKAAAAAPPPVAAPAEDEGGFPWLVVAGVGAGVVVAAAAGVGAYLLLQPPQSVTLKTDVAFAD